MATLPEDLLTFKPHREDLSLLQHEGPLDLAIDIDPAGKPYIELPGRIRITLTKAGAALVAARLLRILQREGTK